MRKLILLFFVFLNSAALFASFSSGYKFYFNNNRNSCIEIRYNDAFVTPYMCHSDGLFFDLLNWIIHNKKELENKVNDHFSITVLPERKPNINEGELRAIKDEYSADGYNLIKFEYKNNKEMLQNVIKIIESYYDFTSKEVINNSFGLYFVWEDTSIRGYRYGVSKQEESTEIFKGPFPGAMFNAPGLKYGVVFWELEQAKNYLNKYRDENYYLEYLIINKDNIRGIFG